MNSGQTPAIPSIDKPSDETLEKIDFVIQGVENGLFEDLSKKIDFHQKLKGEDPKKFIQSLLDVIGAQEQRIEDLSMSLDTTRRDMVDAQTRVSQLEDKVNNYNTDMRGIANALLTIANPDPLGQSATYIDDVAAEQFVTKYKQAY